MLFHAVSRYGLELRLALLVSEFRRCVGRPIKVHVGAQVPFGDLGARQDQVALIEELYMRVQRLTPGAGDLPPESMRPMPLADRRVYPWDKVTPRASGEITKEKRTSDAVEVTLTLAAILVIGFAIAKISRLRLYGRCNRASRRSRRRIRCGSARRRRRFLTSGTASPSSERPRRRHLRPTSRRGGTAAHVRAELSPGL